MRDLTYGIIYNPEAKSDNSLNFVCSDNKIHIRFKDYTSDQLITGFEQKLTYLLTYLVNYSDILTLYDKCNPKDLINYLLETRDVKNIFEAIRYKKQINFKGFKLYPNYKKTTDCLAFGKVNEEVFPLIKDTFGNIKFANLETFLTKLKIGLIDYLFNDSYSIIIHKKSSKNVNEKFINKENKKSNSELDSDLVKLW